MSSRLQEIRLVSLSEMMNNDVNIAEMITMIARHNENQRRINKIDPRFRICKFKIVP